MTLNCVIVEDLEVAAAYTLKCCENAEGLNVLSTFSNVPEALSFLQHTPAELIFLDVEMPGANGFALLDQLPYQPLVILTTSKEAYAYEAFQYQVADFLKKPFTFQRFQEALGKVKNDHQRNWLAAKSSAEAALFIKTDGKLLRLDQNQILFIESMGDYVRFVTPSKKYISLNTLKSMEEKVNPAHFLKVHRSYIVNLHKIDDIRENDLFIQGFEIPISKGLKPEILKRLNII